MKYYELDECIRYRDKCSLIRIKMMMMREGDDTDE